MSPIFRHISTFHNIEINKKIQYIWKFLLSTAIPPPHKRSTFVQGMDSASGYLAPSTLYTPLAAVRAVAASSPYVSASIARVARLILVLVNRFIEIVAEVFSYYTAQLSDEIMPEHHRFY